VKFEEGQPVHVSYDAVYRSGENVCGGHLVSEPTAVAESRIEPKTTLHWVPPHAKVTPLLAPIAQHLTNTSDLANSITEWLRSTDWGDLVDAVRAVLALKPPELDEGDDPALHELLTEGWRTAHHAVLVAIAHEIDADTPPQETTGE
jgi:hypothetical protein